MTDLMTAYLYDSAPAPMGTGTLLHTVYDVPNNPSPDFIIKNDEPYSSYVDISEDEWEYMYCSEANNNAVSPEQLALSFVWDADEQQWLFFGPSA